MKRLGKVLGKKLRGSQNVIPIEETTLFSSTARGLSEAFLRLYRKQCEGTLTLSDSVVKFTDVLVPVGHSVGA